MRALVLLPALLCGCEVLGGGGGGAGDDDDDSGGTTRPAGVPDDIDCRPFVETPAPGEAGLGECVTGSLSCGDTISGTIEGGSTVFSNQHDAAFEWCSGHSTGDDLDGPERVYRLEVPDEYTYVTVRMASCETTQLLWYQTTDVCPTEHVNCSYPSDPGVHGGYEQAENILLGEAHVVWFVVEGLEGGLGNYTLSVECGTY